jgi:hypothetical protein
MSSKRIRFTNAMAAIEVSGRESIADWIETTVLARGSALGHDAMFALGAEELAVGEASIGHALNVLQSRSRILSERYPFVVTSVGVYAKPNAVSYPYSDFLVLSPGSPTRQLLCPTPDSAMAAAFENLVVKAATALAGHGGEALRFGWPSEIGRPKEFDLAITWLAGKTGLRAGSGYRQPRRKDGGVDVVAWKPFPDGRPGLPVYLIQCTLQSNLLEKSLDIDTRIWSTWLTLDADPTTVLAIPGTIGRIEVWNEIALRCLILDRLRLAGLIDLTEAEDASGSGVSLATQLIGEVRPLLMGAAG